MFSHVLAVMRSCLLCRIVRVLARSHLPRVFHSVCQHCALLLNMARSSTGQMWKGPGASGLSRRIVTKTRVGCSGVRFVVLTRPLSVVASVRPLSLVRSTAAAMSNVPRFFAVVLVVGCLMPSAAVNADVCNANTCVNCVFQSIPAGQPYDRKIATAARN